MILLCKLARRVCRRYCCESLSCTACYASLLCPLVLRSPITRLANAQSVKDSVSGVSDLRCQGSSQKDQLSADDLQLVYACRPLVCREIPLLQASWLLLCARGGCECHRRFRLAVGKGFRHTDTVQQVHGTDRPARDLVVRLGCIFLVSSICSPS